LHFPRQLGRVALLKGQSARSKSVRLFLTSSISYIRFRDLAFRFEVAYKSIQNLLDAGLCGEILPEDTTGKIRTLAIMVVFDPVVPAPDGFQVDRYDGRNKLQGIDITFNVSTVSCLNESTWADLIASRILQALDILISARPASSGALHALKAAVKKILFQSQSHDPLALPNDQLPSRTSAPPPPQVIIEVKIKGRSFDELIEIEKTVCQYLPEGTEVDGHDIDDRVFRIFLNGPEESGPDLRLYLLKLLPRGDFKIRSG
jgi:hypothetical protein